MAFFIKEGCCSSSLQKTCLGIGIVFLVVAIAHLITGYICGFTIILVPEIIYMVCCACLIVGAVLKFEYLCIPWIIGYICTIVILVYFFKREVLAQILAPPKIEGFDEKSKEEKVYTSFIVRFVFYTIKYIIETLILGYVVSFFIELHWGEVPFTDSPSTSKNTKATSKNTKANKNPPPKSKQTRTTRMSR